MEKFKLQADTVNGVYRVDAFDDENLANLLSQEDFYSALKNCGANEILCAMVDLKMLERIDEEYGVH